MFLLFPFTGFYRILPGFTEFTELSKRFQPHLSIEKKNFFWKDNGFISIWSLFYMFLSIHFTEFYRVFRFHDSTWFPMDFPCFYEIQPLKSSRISCGPLEWRTKRARKEGRKEGRKKGKKERKGEEGATSDAALHHFRSRRASLFLFGSFSFNNVRCCVF